VDLRFSNGMILLAFCKDKSMPYPTLVIFQQLIVNLSKTKVMIFNALKHVLSKYHHQFQGEEIEITTAYTYIRVQFSGVAVLIHTCKRELSPAHLVCPRRHNA
jgi:hypothetical protein